MHRQEVRLSPGREPHAPGVALVVGTGGAACAAAVGVQRVLRDAGVMITSITGSSSGALVAAALALGWEAETTEVVLKRLWVPAVVRGARRRAAVRLALPRRGPAGAFALTEGTALDARVRRAFGDATFDDVRMPLRIVATDLVLGERVSLESGSVADAVRASMAVPLLVPPVAAGDRLLADGALSDPLPVLAAVADGPRAVVALAFASAVPERAGPLLGSVLAAHAAAANNLLRLASAYHDLTVPVGMLRLEPDLGGPLPLFDGSRIGDAIALGEAAMQARMEELSRLLA